MNRLLLPFVALLAFVGLTASAGAAERPQYYLSLGDSYAVGYQATGQGTGRATAKGFADQLPALARKRGHRLKLVNFGCGGETTTSMLTRKTACRTPAAANGQRYAGRTQIAAAERFLRRNRGKVALITVSIGGNDVTSCVRATDVAACVNAALASIKKNVTAAAKRLRAAGGPKVRIVGTTYPDVILGEWLAGDAGKGLANLSIVAFRDLINPALKDAYGAAKGTLVDVTAATGAYGPMDQTTTLAPYGTLPVPVADVCRLTWYCQYKDIHARTNGYAIIAKLVAATLPRKRG